MYMYEFMNIPYDISSTRSHRSATDVPHRPGVAGHVDGGLPHPHLGLPGYPDFPPGDADGGGARGFLAGPLRLRQNPLVGGTWHLDPPTPRCECGINTDFFSWSEVYFLGCSFHYSCTLFSAHRNYEPLKVNWLMINYDMSQKRK